MRARTALILLLLTSIPVDAQDLRIRIEMEHVIGEEDGTEPAQLLRGVSAVTVGPNDQIYLHQGNTNYVYVYSSAGAYLHKLGSPGQGPGEFGLIRSVIPVPGDLVAITDTQNMKIAVFDAGGRLVDEFRMDMEGMIHPRRWARLGDDGVVMLHSTPASRNTGEMLHVYTPDLTERKESFGTATEIWDQDSEFQVALTGSPHSAHLAIPRDNRVCTVSRVYEGAISCFDRTSDGWKRHELIGREIDEPYRMLDWEEYRSTPGLRRWAWSISGPQGSYAAQVFSMSRGLFALEDGSLIHFATTINAWDETELNAELFSPAGGLVGYGPVRGYRAAESGELSVAHVLWYAGNGVFYLSDHREGYPAVWRARLTIDGHEHVFGD